MSYATRAPSVVVGFVVYLTMEKAHIHPKRETN